MFNPVVAERHFCLRPQKCTIMTTNNKVLATVNNSFAAFINTEIETPQLSFIKGGDGSEGEGDDDANGYVGTEDIVVF